MFSQGFNRLFSLLHCFELKAIVNTVPLPLCSQRVIFLWGGGGEIEAQYCMHGGGQQGNIMDTFVKYSKVPILIANR